MPSIVEITGKLGLDTSEFDSKLNAADAKVSAFTRSAGTNPINLGGADASRDLDSLTSSAERAAAGVEELNASSRSQDIAQAAESAAAWASQLGAASQVAVSAASDVNEAQSAVNTVYGDAAGTIMEMADTSATALGLTRQEALSTASSLGALFTGMDIGQQAAADLSDELILAAADLSSFHNVPVGESMQAIQSGLVGETEGLRRFGIVLDAATVEAKAMEMGLVDLSGEVTEAGKVQARAALITEGLGAAEGDRARTLDSLAGAERTLTAATGNLAAELGESLMPAQLAVVNGQIAMIDTFMKLPPVLQNAGAMVAFTAGRMAPMLQAMSQIAIVAPGVSSAVKGAGSSFTDFATGGSKAAAMLPVLGVALAAVGLGVLAYRTNFLGFGDAVDSVMANATSAAGEFAEAFTEKFQHATNSGMNPFSAGLTAIGSGLAAIAGGETPTWLAEIASGFHRVAYITQQLSVAFSDFRAMGLDPVQAALAALNQIFPGLNGALEVAWDLWNNLKDAVMGVATGLQDALAALAAGDIGGVFQGLADAASAALGGFIDTLGILGGAILQAIQSIDWNAVGSAIQSGLQSLTQWVLDSFNAIDWTAVSATIQAGLQSLSDAFNQWLANVSQWILEGFNQIDWVAVGATLYAGVQNALSALGDFAGLLLEKGGELITGLIAGITDRLPLVGQFFVSWAGGLPNQLPDFLTALSSKGGDLITGLIDGITDRLPEVGTKLKEIVDHVPDITTDLPAKLGDLGGAISQWIAGAAGAVSAAWSSLWGSLGGGNSMGGPGERGEGGSGAASMLTSSLGDLGASLSQWISGALSAVSEAWNNLWATVCGDTSPFDALKDLGTTVFDPVGTSIQAMSDTISRVWSYISGITWGTAFDSLKNLGTDVFDGVGTAIQTMSDTISRVWSYISGITWNTAFDSLANIDDAVFSGIGASIQEMSDTISGVWTYISNITWSDAFAGLETVASGIGGTVEKITSALGGVKEAIAGVFGGGEGGGGGTEPLAIDLTNISAEIPADFGQTIADTIIDQIDSASWVGLETSIQTSVTTAVEGATVAADVGSDVGLAIVTSISQGVETSSADLSSAVEGIVSTAIDAGSLRSVEADIVGTSLVEAIGSGSGQATSTLTAAVEAVVQAGISAGDTKATSANTVGTTLIGAIGSGTGAATATLTGAVEAVVQAGIDAGTRVADTANSVGTALVSALESGVMAMESAATAAVESIVGAAISAGSAKASEATTVGTQLVTSIETGITGASSNMSSVLTGAVQSAIDSLASLAGAAESAGAAIGAAISRGIIGGLDMSGVRGAIESGLAGITANIPVTVNIQENIVGGGGMGGGYYASGVEGGNDYIAGGEQAIQDGAPVLGAAAEDTVAFLASATSGALEATSPSQLMYRIFQSVPEGAALAIIDGIPAIVDAAGQMIEPLNQLEADLMALAQQSGEEAMRNFAETILNGSDWMMDAAGAVVDQFGNFLAEDFSADLENGSVYFGFGERLGAMVTEGMTGAIEEGSVPAKEAAYAAATDAASGYTEAFTVGIQDGVAGLWDAAGTLIAPLNEVELALVQLAAAQGETYLRKLVEHISNGATYALNESGAIVDQFGQQMMLDFDTSTEAMASGATAMGEAVITAMAEGVEAGSAVLSAAIAETTATSDRQMMEAGTAAAADAGYATGNTYSKEVAAGLEAGSIYVTDAAGNIIRGLNEVEWQMAVLAREAGDQFIANLASVLASGATLVLDEMGRVTDGMGNLLASDFTLIAEDSLVAGYDIVSALANGMVGATPQVVGAGVYVSDAATAPMVEMATRAYDAGSDSVIQAAGGMLETAPVLADAAATVTGGVTDQFVQMYNEIVGIVNDMLAQAGVAARAANEISVSSSAASSDSVSRDTGGGRVRIDESGGRARGRNADASGGRVRHGDIDRNARVDIDASGGRSVDRTGRGGGGRGGDVYITNHNNIQDGRDFERTMRRQQREAELHASRS